MTRIQGHAGAHAVAVARGYGVETMFTLSGGHVFPLYDGAVKADPPLRILDVRHEQTAVFAAEATAKLTRTPGFAVLTAGPGVTNGLSAVATAHFNGSPVVVFGGRAPLSNWGRGALQEIDQPPMLAPITKRAFTAPDTAGIAAAVDEAFRLAMSPHRGPVFLDAYMDHLFDQAEVEIPAPAAPAAARRSGEAREAGDVEPIARLLAAAERPVLVLGSDVWTDGADAAARAAAEELRVPVITNG